MAEKAAKIFNRLAPPAPRRKRLLIVNVFYPPQAIGGATRVVADTARAFRAAHGDGWDIDVICTRHGGSHPLEVTMWSDSGIRVHAITAPTQEAGDMKAIDGRMGALFERLMDRIAPDLVHFHCIQRLTASVVAVRGSAGFPMSSRCTTGGGFRITSSCWMRRVSCRPMIMRPARRGALRSLPPCCAGRRGWWRFCPLRRAAPCGGLAYGGRAGKRTSRSWRDAAPARPKGAFKAWASGGMAAIKGLPLVQSALMAGDFPNLDLTVIDHARHYGPRGKPCGAKRRCRFCPPFHKTGWHSFMPDWMCFWPHRSGPKVFGLVAREARAAGLWVVASDRGAIGADLRDGVDGFVVDVAQAGPLMAVLAQMNADPQRFVAPPPAPAVPPRGLAEQVADMAALYASVLQP